MKRTLLKKYFFLISLLIIPLLAVIFFVGKIPAQNENPFEKKIFIPKPGDTLLYRLLRPLKNDSSIKFPLVIFLHGAGEENVIIPLN